MHGPSASLQQITGFHHGALPRSGAAVAARGADAEFTVFLRLAPAVVESDVDAALYLLKGKASLVGGGTLGRAILAFWVAPGAAPTMTGLLLEDRVVALDGALFKLISSGRWLATLEGLGMRRAESEVEVPHDIERPVVARFDSLEHAFPLAMAVARSASRDPKLDFVFKGLAEFRFRGITPHSLVATAMLDSVPAGWEALAEEAANAIARNAPGLLPRLDGTSYERADRLLAATLDARRGRALPIGIGGCSR